MANIRGAGHTTRLILATLSDQVPTCSNVLWISDTGLSAAATLERYFGVLRELGFKPVRTSVCTLAYTAIFDGKTTGDVVYMHFYSKECVRKDWGKWTRPGQDMLITVDTVEVKQLCHSPLQLQELKDRMFTDTTSESTSRKSVDLNDYLVEQKSTSKPGK